MAGPYWGASQAHMFQLCLPPGSPRMSHGCLAPRTPPVLNRHRHQVCDPAREETRLREASD